MARYRDQPVRDAFMGVGVAGLALVVFVLLALLVTVMWVFSFGFFSNASANFRGEVSKRNLVEANGNYRIAAYDHFFDLCTSIQTYEATITNLQEELKTKPPADRVEQINASITANRNQRASSIAQYNNDANKSYTVGQFLDSHLPWHLDPNQENTTCSTP